MFGQVFGQITDLEVVREIERRGIYTSAIVEPLVTPITDLVPEPDIIYPVEEPIEFPEEPVIVYPRYEEERVPYIPIVTPPFVTPPAIPIPEKEPFALTTTHMIAGAALLAVIFLFARRPSASKPA